MDEILIFNQRPIGGFLYHYAHFIQDCIFPEIVHLKTYHNKNIIRKYNVRNHLGGFQEFYEKILNVKVIYLTEEEFKKKKKSTKNLKKTYGFLWTLYNVPFAIHKFQKYIYKKIRLSKLTFHKYDIILIERGVKKLIDDFTDTTLTGSQRREMVEIDQVENFVKRQSKRKNMTYLRVQLEHLSFEEQVFLFYHAHLIIGIHGAGLSNLLFCEKYTKVIEIRPIISNYFSEISKFIPLIHIQCKNDYWSIIQNIRILLNI